MADLQVSISTIVDTNFGDHGERIRTDHEAVLGETVEDLVRRVFPLLGDKYRSHHPADVIEIRVMVDRSGEVTGKPAKPSAEPF